jgi:hypothetical protein
VSLSLPAGANFTGFLHQIPSFANLPSPLQGILTVSTADGSPNLRARYNEEGDFLLSSVPLIPASPPPPDAELIIPQIVDGGGYATSFILLDNSPAPVNVLLRLMGASGQPLKLNLK